jgi:hypothetical protein
MALSTNRISVGGFRAVKSKATLIFGWIAVAYYGFLLLASFLSYGLILIDMKTSLGPQELSIGAGSLAVGLFSSAAVIAGFIGAVVVFVNLAKSIIFFAAALLIHLVTTAYFFASGELTAMCDKYLVSQDCYTAAILDSVMGHLIEFVLLLAAFLILRAKGDGGEKKRGRRE